MWTTREEESMGYAFGSIDELGEGYGFRKIPVPLGITAFGANAVVFPPGHDSFNHYHDTQDELYIVHRGTARVEMEGETRGLGPGGLLHVESTTPGRSRTRATATTSCSSSSAARTATSSATATWSIPPTSSAEPPSGAGASGDRRQDLPRQRWRLWPWGRDGAPARGVGAQAVVADLPETDVTDEESVQRLVDSLEELHGAVNCAGIGASARVVGRDEDGPFPLDLFRAVVDVNLTGTFNVIRLAATKIARNEPDENGSAASS